MSDATHEHPAHRGPPGHPGFTFGPSALVTPANAVTVARLLAAPVYVLMLVVWGASWINVVVGLVLAGSDGLDGYMARRHGTTRSGAFLDPLADKAVVLGALVTLAAQGHLPWLPVVLIAIREVGMQLYRSWVGRRGVSIPAGNSAKLKTLVQDFAVGTCIIRRSPTSTRAGRHDLVRLRPDPLHGCRVRARRPQSAAPAGRTIRSRP